jgi:hypothetical protein
MNMLTPEIIGWAKQGVVPAALKIAAGMIESGLGQHIPPNSNNWFGIKGDGPLTPTREETAAGHWYTIRSGFKMFASPAAGFAYYDWLISHGAPYAQAWKVWLASDKSPTAVERLTKDIAIRYASALSYATALIAAEETNKLFQYDQGEKLTMAAIPVVPPSTNPPPVVIDYGDLLDKIIADFEPMAAMAAQAGVQVAAGMVPEGSIILDFLGAQTISQFVAQGAAALEELFKGKNLTIPHATALETSVLSAIKNALPGVASFLGDKLAPMVSVAVAKALPPPLPDPTVPTGPVGEAGKKPTGIVG